MNWLLLRGLSREKRHWGTFPQKLALASGDRVHCLDLPGFGTEIGRPSPSSIRGIVRDVRARWLVLKEHHPGPWALMGMSLGGMVTMEWGALFPDDFKRLVVVNTSAGNLSRPWERMQWAVLPNVVRSLIDSNDEARERRILGMTTAGARNIDELARTWAAYASEGKPERLSVVRQLIAAARYRAPRKLVPPLLVVSGGADALCAPACPRAVARHFGAAFEVHPDGGHELAVDAGDWLAKTMADWAASDAGESAAS